MNKRLIWLIFSFAIIAFVVAFGLLIDKVSVQAASFTLADQDWRATLSQPVNKEAIDKGYILLKNQQGKTVKAEMELTNDGHTIVVKGLSPGSYTLHIKEKAVSGRLFKSLSQQKLPFTVREDLKPIQSMDELKTYFKNAWKENPPNGSMSYAGSDRVIMESASSDDANKGMAVSGTNAQVEGIDEGDIAKSDGEYIYSIFEQRVVMTDVRDPKNMKVVDTWSGLQNYPTELFLNGDYLYVLTNEMKSNPSIETTKPDRYYPEVSLTSLTILDISSKKEMTEVRTVSTEGNFVSARLKDDTIYFVTSTMPDYWLYEQQKSMELRPYTFDSKKGDELTPLEIDHLSLLPNSQDTQYSLITAIDLADPVASEVETNAYLGSSGDLYMNDEHLYLAAGKWDYPKTNDGNRMMDIAIMPMNSRTEFYKFDLNGQSVDFIASTEVDGQLLNQFSMDEYDGYFRVAVTKGDAWNSEVKSTNNVFIFDAGMKQVGKVEGLAEGEKIYSVRFMGDTAYVVTFKRVDPLFVLDVKDPTAPKVVGELKVPGFSNYLHPLDEQTLIGFGQNTKEVTDSGNSFTRSAGVKISLFDVSDRTKPNELQATIIGNEGTYSDISYTHKALYVNKEKNLYGFPIEFNWMDESDLAKNPEQYGSGMIFYEITKENGIQEKSRIMTNLSTMTAIRWSEIPKRAISIGDTLYTISSNNIQSYQLDSFERINQVFFY